MIVGVVVDDSWWCTGVQNVGSLYLRVMNPLAMNLGQQGYLDVVKTWILVSFPVPITNHHLSIPI
jgi:hypothetical protein